MDRETQWANMTWTIKVCPICGAQSPSHKEPCLSDDPPSLREIHQPHKVVSAAWRAIAKRKED